MKLENVFFAKKSIKRQKSDGSKMEQGPGHEIKTMDYYNKKASMCSKKNIKNKMNNVQ